MTVSKSFEQYVKEGNMTTIKVSLVELLKNDLTHNMFNEYMDYLDMNNIDIYQEHDGESYADIQYNENFLTEQLNQLIRNFSKERLRCVQAIQNKLYGEQLKQQIQEEIKYNNSNSVKKAVGSMFIAAGTLTVALSIISSLSLGFAVLGTVMVAGGVIVLLTNKEG